MGSSDVFMEPCADCGGVPSFHLWPEITHDPLCAYCAKQCIEFNKMEEA